MQISGLPVSATFGAADVLAIEINGVTYKVTGATLAAALQSMGDYVTAQDIANNLTTTDAGYVLDARQGKALLDAIEALGAADVGAVAADQGAANAGKALVVGNDGNVTTGKTVRPDAAQTLTAAEQAQARGNIGAASATELAAETAAREAADSELKSAFDELEEEILIDNEQGINTWYQGSSSWSNGSNVSNNNIVRTDFIEVKPGYKKINWDKTRHIVRCMVYTSNNISSYTQALSRSFDDFAADDGDISAFVGKYIKLNAGLVETATFSPSDVQSGDFGLVFNTFTDDTLTRSGKSADAKETGDRITNIKNSVGEIVTANFTKPSSGNAVKNFEYPIKAGIPIRFVWVGENAASNDSLNLYSRQTAFGENLETLCATAKSGIMYEATPSVDANYLRVVATKTGYIKVYNKGTLIDRMDEMEIDIAQIKDEMSAIPETPFVQFEFSHDMYDPSAIFGETGEIGNINGWTSKAEALTKVHAAFDALCASGGAGYGYGERITGLYKENASDEALLDLIAPDYVTQGVSQGQTVVLPIGTDSNGDPVTYNYTYESDTEPYEVRLYRFHDTNSALHTATVDIPKKKILLVGGTHGNEFCAPINLYILAKHLCTDFNNPDVLKLRSSFDVYIVPYLNGFGCQYKWSNGGTMTTGSRSNGRMVDINRNCYTAGWVGASGTAEQITAHFVAKIANLATNTFAGASNGSEFESQLIKGLVEYIQPDVFIDHHHNSGNTPFYTTCRGNYAGNLIYQAANDTAYARMHNMPEYFGTKYNLFLGSDVSPATKSAQNGHMDTMAYELGVKMNGVQEMPESIAYLNGAVDSATKTATKYSPLAFKQAEYTLLNVALHMCQWAMEHD